MMVYQIPMWDEEFENNKSRDVDECSFVAMPNKQHGMGLTRILAREDGAAVFGIWCLILQAASRQPRPRQGWLTDDGQANGLPWDAEDMALRWRRPVTEIQNALAVLSSAKIGWLVAVEMASADSVPPNCQAGAVVVPPKCRPGAEALPTDCPPTTLEGRKEGREGKEAPRRPEGSRAAPPAKAPIDSAKTDQAHREREVRKILIAGGCRSGVEQIEEWRLLISEVFAGTTFAPAVKLDAIERAIRNGKQSGKPVSYAREAADFLGEWVAKLKAAADKGSAENEEAA